MPTPKLSRKDAEQAVALVEEAVRDGFSLGGLPSAVLEGAKRAGMKDSSFRRRLLSAEKHYGLRPRESAQKVDILDLPDADEVWRRMRSYTRGHISRFYAEKSLNLTVRSPVFGAWFMGDPHLDSPGTDHARMLLDLDLIKDAQAEHDILAFNIGDTLDNWPKGGRLAKKLSDGPISAREALALTKSLAGALDWTAWLIGNHDEWAGLNFRQLMQEWGQFRISDWGMFVHVDTPGREWVIAMHHDFPGHSMHNPLHALMRRAREEGGADLYVAGHRHTGGQGKFEDGHRDRTYNIMRVRGYKRADEYAFQRGYAEQEEGCSGLAVFNANAKMQDSEIRTFYDLQEGLDWMRFLKGRAS